MLDSPVPPDVREFIMRNIDSIGEVEALLLLRGEPSALWTGTSVAARLYITETAATNALERLHALGVAVRDNGGSRYACASEELELAVHRLIDAYKSFLIPVTNLIHSKSASRVREFADAFHFTKRR